MRIGILYVFFYIEKLIYFFYNCIVIPSLDHHEELFLIILKT